jgi:hypothetical protein
MKHRVVAAPVAAAVFVALSLVGGGAAHAGEHQQPANLGNVANADRGASAEGPHCHFVVPADGKGKFGRIITGAAHQAHAQTGTPVGIFQLVTCPGEE